MTESLRLLLAAGIDYAGLFPPANLPLQQALDEYLELQAGPHEWIVCRFVCPATQLGDLQGLLNGRDLETSFPVAVIGSCGDQSSNLRDCMKRDLDSIESFEGSTPDLVAVEAYESKLAGGGRIEEALGAVQALTAYDIFLELPLGPNTGDQLAAMAEAECAGAKCRTGGPSPETVPSSKDLAVFMQQCMHLDLPFKLTAGLHHPIRHHDPVFGGRMHGFLNVFAAATLIEAHDLSRSEIEALLEDEDPSSFGFDDSGLFWKGFKAEIDDIEDARTLFVSYGSCSIHEPIEGLQKLKLIR
jgi:hypothetical protein